MQAERIRRLAGHRSSASLAPRAPKEVTAVNGHAVPRHASCAEAKIAAGLAAGQVNEALSLVHAAFAQKLRIGFRDARDLVRLFRDAVDATSCFSARVNGQCAGILLFQTVDQEFFRLNLGALFTRFAPLRAVLMLGNLALLADSVRPEEFRVDALAVDRRFQGMGLGTALMRQAEAHARAGLRHYVVRRDRRQRRRHPSV